ATRTDLYNNIRRDVATDASAVIAPRCVVGVCAWQSLRSAATRFDRRPTTPPTAGPAAGTTNCRSAGREPARHDRAGADCLPDIASRRAARESIASLDHS